MRLDSPSPDVPPAPTNQNPSARDGEDTTRPTGTGATEVVPVPPITSPASVLPHVFDSTDASISWVGNHPYWNCEALGQGAFGSVRKVSLLTPLGYTVSRDATGMPKVDADEDMLLRPMREEEWVRLAGGDDAALQALKASVSDSNSVQWSHHLNFSGLFCAAKTIGATNKDLYQRAREEIKLLKKLAHTEHVVRMYDSAATWTGEFGRVVIVMELGEMDFGHYLKSRSGSDENGGEAQNRVPGSVVLNMTSRQETSISQEGGGRRPMDAFEVFVWWQQMVAAVQAVHSQDIMHCDIKPCNFIMVRKKVPERESSASPARRWEGEPEEYTLKLCDFGVSRQLKDSQTHLSILNAFGTLLYMSPEMLHTTEDHWRLHVTKAVDIWGLGVILHEMLHNGSTLYGHLAKYGRYRLIAAIPDEKAAKMQTACPRLLEGGDEQAVRIHDRATAPGGLVPEGDFLCVSTRQRRHDVLLGLQLACLQRPVAQRPTAVQLSSLNETAKQFFHGARDGIVESGTDGDNNNSGAETEAPEIADGSARDDGNSATVRDDNSTVETRGVQSPAVGSSISRDEGAMALKVLIGRVVAVNAAACMALSSDATSHGPHDEQRGGSPLTMGLLSGPGDGSSTSAGDHAPTSNSTAPLAPAHSLESHHHTEDELSSRRTSCGIKGMLIGIGLSVLVAIVTGLLGFWASSGRGEGETYPSPKNNAPQSNAPQSNAPQSNAPQSNASQSNAPRSSAPSSPSFLGGSHPPASRGSPPPPVDASGEPPGQVSSSAVPGRGACEISSSTTEAGNPGAGQGSPKNNSSFLPSTSHASASRPPPPPGNPSSESVSSTSFVDVVPGEGEINSPTNRSSPVEDSDPPRESAENELKKKWLACVRWDGDDLRHAPPQLQGDRDVVLAAFSMRPSNSAFQYASVELRRDKAFVLEVVARKGLALEYASAGLKADKEVVLAAAAQNSLAFQFAAVGLTKDKEFVLKVVAQNPRGGIALKYASDELTTDEDVVLAAVTQYGSAFQYAAAELINDRAFVLRAVARNANADAFGFVAAGLKSDREFVLKVVAQNGLALRHASVKLKADKEVVLAAVAQEVQAFDFADIKLRSDRDFISKVIGQNNLALHYEIDELKTGKKFGLAVVVQNGLALQYRTLHDDVDERPLLSPKNNSSSLLSSHASASRPPPPPGESESVSSFVVVPGEGEINSPPNRSSPVGWADPQGESAENRVKKKWLTHVRRDGDNLEYAPPQLRGDRDVVLAAVEHCTNGRAFKHASQELTENREFVSKVVAQNGSLFMYASYALISDREFVLEVVARNGLALEYASDGLKSDKEVVMAAVAQNVQAFDFADINLRSNRAFVAEVVEQNNLALHYETDELKTGKKLGLAVVAQNGLALLYRSTFLFSLDDDEFFGEV